MAYKGFTDKWDWVMAGLVAVVIFAVMLTWCGRGLASEVEVVWNPMSWPEGSDPGKSGVDVYISHDGGDTWTHKGTAPMGQDSLKFEEEIPVGSSCVSGIAFNQNGRSDRSAGSPDACTWRASGPPPKPSKVELMIQEVIAMLKDIKGTLEGMVD